MSRIMGFTGTKDQLNCRKSLLCINGKIKRKYEKTWCIYDKQAVGEAKIIRLENFKLKDAQQNP